MATKTSAFTHKAKAAFSKARTAAKGYMQQRPHRSFVRTTKRKALGGQPFSPVWHLLRDVWQFIRAEKKPFFLLGALYAGISFFMVGGISQTDFLGLKEATQQVASGDFGAFGTTATLFAAAISNSLSAPGGEVQQVLGGLVIFIFWLALVWFIRMRSAGNKVKVRDALYNCGSPIVASFVLLLIMVVQLLPAVLGVYLLTTAQAEGWVRGGAELMMYSGAAALLCLLSAYWVSATLLALVVVTLPQTYPWQALAAASELVVGQRWKLALRVGIMLLVVLFLWAVLLFPTLLLDSWLKFDWLPLVPIMAQAITTFTLVFVSVYIYKLYRSLL